MCSHIFTGRGILNKVETPTKIQVTGVEFNRSYPQVGSAFGRLVMPLKDINRRKGSNSKKRTVVNLIFFPTALPLPCTIRTPESMSSYVRSGKNVPSGPRILGSRLLSCTGGLDTYSFPREADEYPEKIVRLVCLAMWEVRTSFRAAFGRISYGHATIWKKEISLWYTTRVSYFTRLRLGFH